MRARPRAARVWLVLDDAEDAPEPVVAVLADEDEARAFVEAHVPRDFPTLVYAPYAVGWTYDDGARRHRG